MFVESMEAESDLMVVFSELIVVVVVCLVCRCCRGASIVVKA